MKFTEAQLEQAFIHLTVSRYTICGEKYVNEFQGYQNFNFAIRLSYNHRKVLIEAGFYETI
jgi:hypothetical protein